MNRTTVQGGALRRAAASVGAGGLALLLLAIAAGPASASPHLRARVSGGTLLIFGTPFAEQITLRLSATDRNGLEVDLDNDGSADATFDLTNIDTIEVDAGGGNDRIDGNGGADTAFLGRGDDTFVWDPGDGSDVVEGGTGSDTMVFNGSGGNEIMAARANFGRVSFTRNLGVIAMDLDGIEAIDVRALGGTDSVTVNDMTGTDLRRVDVDLASTLGGSTGDGAADTVAVNGTKGDDSIAAVADGAAVEVRGLAAEVRVTHADPASDALVIDPVTGDNKVAVDPAVKDLIQVSVL